MTALWTDNDLKALFGAQDNLHKNLLSEARGVSINTRTLQKGDLFVALKGPLADGHHYLKQAFEAGASGAVVSSIPDSLGSSPHSIFARACFLVSDTFTALQKMGIDRRSRSLAKVAAVTGSYGKTSCKEALVQLLSRQGLTYGTASSFNNHWGVPLSLASLPRESRFGIFEVGMNNPGEISPLSMMVKPDVSLITTVAGAHLGNMGSLEATAREKAAIFEGMSSGGIAVINEQSAEFDLLKDCALKKGLTPLVFGHSSGAFARLKGYDFYSGGLSVEADIDGQPYTLTLPVTQDHWAMSALGVLATVYALDGDVAKAVEDFRDYKVPEGRGELCQFPYKGGQIIVVDESYNAGPGSMKEALQALGRLRSQNTGRCIAVLADMLELGDHSEKEHRALGPLLHEAGVDCLYTVGNSIKFLHQDVEASKLKGHVSSNEEIKELCSLILKDVRPGDIYLVKGSRGQRAYRGRLACIVDALKALGPGEKKNSAQEPEPYLRARES